MGPVPKSLSHSSSLTQSTTPRHPSLALLSLPFPSSNVFIPLVGCLYSIVSKLFHSLPLPLVPPPLVSTILQIPSVYEMLSLPCTRSFLSILILIIHSAMPAEVLPLPLAVAPAPSPTSSSSDSDMAVLQAQAKALIAIKDAITHDPSSCLSSWTIQMFVLAGPDASGASFPSSLGDCQQLHTLTLSMMGLQGAIPPSIWQLPHLQTLVIEDLNMIGAVDNLPPYKLHGSLPSTFGFCGAAASTIELISILGINLTGNIPTSIATDSGSVSHKSRGFHPF